MNRALTHNSDFDPLTSRGLEPVFWTPERLGRLSAWWGHVPFAFWLVTKTEPRLLVELGTHYGVSYAAFCEAVLRLRLRTRCYAVDTWTGDPHAGFYNAEVYTELKEFHDNRYASFSQLVRKTFDEACDDFADGSIDLLHIDGLHTYEAVRHDFETWRPKLSSRALVLFHDTNERGRDFGVWRFLGELKREAPAFEFLHEHGLGLVAVGADVPEAVKRLFELKDETEIAAVRQRFSQIGARWMVEQEKSNLAANRDQFAAQIAAALEEHAAQFAAARHEFASQLAAERDNFASRLAAERDNFASRLGAEHGNFASQLEAARKEFARQLDANRGELATLLAERDARLAEKNGLVADKNRLIAEREQEIGQTEAALSRVTGERDFLARCLSRTYHRPWRPFKHHVNYHLLRSFSALTAPFSERTASRFASSAQKRSPSRFDAYLGGADLLAAPSSDGVAEVEPGLPVRLAAAPSSGATQKLASACHLQRSSSRRRASDLSARGIEALGLSWPFASFAAEAPRADGQKQAQDPG